MPFFCHDPFFHHFLKLTPLSEIIKFCNVALVTCHYSIVKESSVDLGVNSKIVQIRATVKAVSTKILKKCRFVNILILLSENKEASFFLF